jgi:hypothetical protein
MTVLTTLLWLAALGAAPAASPAEVCSEEGARRMLARFLEPDANIDGLSKAMRPSAADYSAIISDASARERAEKRYESTWTAGKIVVHPLPGQRTIVLSSVGSNDLKTGSPAIRPWSEHWVKVAGVLANGLVIYSFWFVEKGSDVNEPTKRTGFDGLMCVENHWVLLPKLWWILGGT